MIRAGLIGACAAIALAFPMAAVTALVYRFPIPLGGYASGPAAVPLSLIAVAFYGVLFGGFIVLGVLGFAAGVVAARVAPGRSMQVRLTVLLSSVLALAGVIALAILDKLIGPW